LTIHKRKCYFLSPLYMNKNLTNNVIGTPIKIKRKTISNVNSCLNLIEIKIQDSGHQLITHIPI